MKCTYCHRESAGRIFCPHCMRRTAAPMRYKNKKIPRLFAREILLFCLAAVLCGAVCLLAAWCAETSIAPDDTESQTAADTASAIPSATETEFSEAPSSSEPDSTSTPGPAGRDMGAVIDGIRRELDSRMIWSPIALANSHFRFVSLINNGETDSEMIRSFVQAAKREERELGQNAPDTPIYYYIAVELQDEKPYSITMCFSSQSSSSEPA